MVEVKGREESGTLWWHEKRNGRKIKREVCGFLKAVFLFLCEKCSAT